MVSNPQTFYLFAYYMGSDGTIKGHYEKTDTRSWLLQKSQHIDSFWKFSVGFLPHSHP